MKDVKNLKLAVGSRATEILVSVGRLTPELLDGRHHPCPKCGGKDRFRLIDREAGAVYCNQCFANGNGDFISAIQWLLGCNFATAMANIREYIGMEAAPVATKKKVWASMDRNRKTTTTIATNEA